MKTTELRDLIHGIATQMEELANIMATPDSVDFDSVYEDFGSLELAANLKPAIDAAFAYLADLHQAGRKVSSTKTEDFLMRQLDISAAEARRRIKRGNDLFAPAPQPEPEAPADEKLETPEEREARKAEERRQWEAAQRARKAARQQKSVSDEKRRLIEHELEAVTAGAQPGKDELRAAALAEARRRSPSDLRNWLRDQVRAANKSGQPDPDHAFKKRYFRLGKQDAHGGVSVHGYLPADYAAIIAAAMSTHNLDAAARARGEDPDKITASYGQQCADRLREIFADASLPTQERTGCGSVVISMTLEDIQEMDPTSSFPTNTGYYLNPAALHRLGPALTDYFVLHDKQGRSLSVGRGQRSATLEQRIALLASELVCQTPGCDCPMTMSDVHHKKAWSRGGNTDIGNLTLMCWNDHPNNNDKADGSNNMGHMDTDPETGRSGWRDPGSDKLRFNESTAAQHSAGAKIRRKYSPQPESDDPPPLFNMAQ